MTSTLHTNDSLLSLLDIAEWIRVKFTEELDFQCLRYLTACRVVDLDDLCADLSHVDETSNDYEQIFLDIEMDEEDVLRIPYPLVHE